MLPLLPTLQTPGLSDGVWNSGAGGNSGCGATSRDYHLAWLNIGNGNSGGSSKPDGFPTATLNGNRKCPELVTPQAVDYRHAFTTADILSPEQGFCVITLPLNPTSSRWRALVKNPLPIRRPGR